MFFEAMVFFCTDHNGLHDNLFSIYDNRTPRASNIPTHKQRNFKYNQQRPSFFHNSNLLNVFFCKDNSHHYGNFFSIYVFHNPIIFSTFYHIEISPYLNYISPFFKSYRSYILPKHLHVNKGDTFRYGKHPDIDEDRIYLFFSDMVYRKNGVQDPYHYQGF